MTRSLLAALSSLALVAAATPAFAFPDASGETGRSGKTAGVTCNSSCHGPSGTQPSVTLTGPATLAAGAVGNFTLTIANNASPNTSSGCDIATSSAQAVLAKTTANLTLAGGELVQASPLAMSNGAATYKFTITTPGTAGSFTVYAYGMATDGSGSGGDNGKAATMTVNVTGGGGSADMAGGPVDAGTSAPGDMAAPPTGGGTGGGTGTGGGNGGGTSSGAAPDMAQPYNPPGGLPGCTMSGPGGGGDLAPLALVLLAGAFVLVRRRRRS